MIDFIDKHSSHKILSTYYMKYSFYIPSPKRKMSYLYKQHLKHSKVAGTERKIMRNKLKVRSRGGEVKVKELAKAILAYHHNLQNIL